MKTLGVEVLTYVSIFFGHVKIGHRLVYSTANRRCYNPEDLQEGVDYIWGHHTEDSEEGKALLAAYALWGEIGTNEKIQGPSQVHVSLRQAIQTLARKPGILVENKTPCNTLYLLGKIS